MIYSYNGLIKVIHHQKQRQQFVLITQNFDVKKSIPLFC